MKKQKIALLSLITFVTCNMVNNNYVLSAGKENNENQVEVNKNFDENNIEKEENSEIGKEQIEEIEKENNLKEDNNKEIEKKELAFIGNCERPLDNSNSTGDIYLKGWAQSEGGIKSVKVEIDGKYYGEAKYGLERADIHKKYPEYNNLNSGYGLELKGLKDGKNNVKVLVENKSGQVHENKLVINVNSSQKSLITGKAKTNPNKMKNILKNNNSNKDNIYINYFIDTVIEEANKENIRYDIAFAQMMHETNYLKFGGDVKEEQNNFGGIGATGNGVPGESFKDIRTGIRASIQHLKAYANNEKLIEECVDPRFKYVERGSAKYLEHLGINENPTGKGWAASKNYGYSIYNLMDRIEKASANELPADPLKTTFKFSSEREVGKAIKITANSNRENVEYLYEVKDNSTGKYSVIKDYTTDQSVNWVPVKSGNYMLAVTTRDKITGEINVACQNGLVINEAEPMTLTFKYGSERKVGKPIEITANSNRENVEYLYEVKDNSTGKYSVIKDYSASKTINWVPNKAGNYMLAVTARDKVTGEIKIVCQNGLVIEGQQLAPMTLTFKYGSERKVGKPIEITANSNRENVEYLYEVKDNLTGKYSVIKDYSASKTVNWVPNKAGNYMLAVTARDKVTGEIKIVCQNGLVIEGQQLEPMTLTFKYGSERKVGKPIEITANSNRENVEFLYEVKDNLTGKYSVIKDYSASKTVNWIPNKAGNYMLAVTARDKVTGEIKIVCQNGLIISEDTVAPLTGSFKYNGSHFVNEEIKITAESNRRDVEYLFEVKDNETGKYSTIRAYGKGNTAVWKPVKAGSYMLALTVRDIKTGESKIVCQNGVIIKETKIIVLDPGHSTNSVYGVDTGSRHKHNGKEYREEVINMQLTIRLRDELEKLGHKVRLTQEPGAVTTDKTVKESLERRASFANANNATVFISVHHNSMSSASINGSEVYYSSSRNGAYEEGAPEKSKELAIGLSKIIASNGQYYNRGAKDGNLYVTKNTEMVSTLTESGFLSNPSDAIKAGDPQNQLRVAKAMAKYIDEFLKK